MEYIDVHTHSPRNKGTFLQNIFAQDLQKDFSPAGYCSIGFHPWHIGQYPVQKMISTLQTHATHAYVLSIGECGLDKNIRVPLSSQEEVFRLQLSIAEMVEKPVIIHCVKAYTEIIRIRKERNWKVPWLFHWFNSSTQVAEELVRLNCYLSFGRSLLKTDGKNAAVFSKIPAERIFLETDDADVSIEDLYQAAARIKDLSLNELTNQIRQNFFRLFGK